ncbi:response regulator transcription factor [Apilactobacillus bombintestini]|uniref:DNA-binding response regulator n=1 Tax=Apilactobacillus bombintestini TaxID=2419772 RepID=A0A387ATJ9_9LACO|nr:response regulator transcription factor [Apilactobacillus bombintestini]AYF92978.1 DNA-binding response regulator [Apilactobacillus bombintestini]
MKVLVVDDDQEIAELLKIYITNEGWDVVIVNDGEAALSELRKNSDIGLMLLDVMMPKMSGMEVLKRVRREIGLPIMIISAKTDDMDKIAGLIGGADDYITKPFNPLEVVARMRSVLRRYSDNVLVKEPEIIHVGTLTINREAHEVKNSEGENIALTAIEFGILYLLASHPGRVYSANEIFESVWRQESIISAKTVMVHVSHLRDKLEAATNGRTVIETVWGVGYRVNENQE